MYHFMRGKLVEATPVFIILETAGIGYKIFIPASALSELPQLGEECFLHTSYVVREFVVALYGFLRPVERDLFELLQNVSGIGPKTALSLIGHLGPASLQAAVHGEEVFTLCKVPGIGKKTAERLIIELRDKILPAQTLVNMPQDPSKTKISDAMNALVNLGYNHMTAQKALKKSLKELPETIDLGALVTHALKNV